MKSIFFACFLIVSSAAISQDKTCNLWLGDGSDSTNNLKQFAEKSGQAGVSAEIFSYPTESLISRPQERRRSE